MQTYRVLAQSIFGSQRIAKEIQGWTQAEVMRKVAPQLDLFHYYVVAIEFVR